MDKESKFPITLTYEILEAFLKDKKALTTLTNEELLNKLLDLSDQVNPITIDHTFTNIEALIHKYDTKEIRQLKVKVKEILETNTVKALKELKNQLKDDCSLFDDLTGLIARYNRIDQYLRKGLIPYSEAHMEFTKIDNSAIMAVNEIDENDLKKTQE